LIGVGNFSTVISTRCWGKGRRVCSFLPIFWSAIRKVRRLRWQSTVSVVPQVMDPVAVEPWPDQGLWPDPLKGWWLKLFTQKPQKNQGEIPGFLDLGCFIQDSAQADLAENALAGEHFGSQANHETKHGQAAIPGFSESHEAEAGFRSSHWMRLRSVKQA